MADFIFNGVSEFLSCHSVSFGLHVTLLIVLKASLTAGYSNLVPDKINHGYGFSCDGPGRGGTCDLTSLDAIYLASF
jgi:hypothetical protein